MSEVITEYHSILGMDEILAWAAHNDIALTVVSYTKSRVVWNIPNEKEMVVFVLKWSSV